jgi:hypothetical protein
MAQLIALPWLQVTLENGSNIMESCMRLNATKAFFQDLSLSPAKVKA